MKHQRLLVSALALISMFAFAAPARADATIFLGRSRNSPSASNTSTVTQGLKGAAFGIGLLVVGFEVEGAIHSENLTKSIPSLKTGMGNVLVQTPTGNVQLYGTAGGGFYQESFTTSSGASSSSSSKTNFISNIGGGIKFGIVGPLRLRADYRILNLRGTPKYSTIQRFYVGASLKF